MEETNQVTNLLDTLQNTSTSEWITALKTYAYAYGPNVIGAVVLLLLGMWIAKLLAGVIRKVVDRKGISPIIGSFIANITHIALLAFIAISALGILGVPTASFDPVIAAAGLAIGLALQGSLSNFAAGFLLIIFQPYQKGDYVEAGGTAGIVEEIQVFTTVLKTPDNKKVIVPNSGVMGGNITNFSAHATRRVDWVFGVSYTDDIDKVKATIRKVIEADERVQKDPAVVVVLSALADSSVNFTARAWVKAPDFWNTFFEINEKMKKTFDAEDISIPFPQRDVHLFQETKA
jgi:small conductance mechanosensitive channel